MWRSAFIAVAFGLAASNAQAGDASDVAERGAFLLGHAYRCGVQTEQLQPAARLIHDLAAALAADEDDKTAADKVFAERFVVSAVADSLGQLLPSCATVKRELAQLEQHNPDALPSGSSAAPAREHLTSKAPAHGGPKHARAARAERSVKPSSHRVAARQTRRHSPAV